MLRKNHLVETMQVVRNSPGKADAIPNSTGSVKVITSVGQMLKLFRKDKGFYQKELAGRLEISREYLSRLEHDRAQPSVKLLVRISLLTGRPIQAVVNTERASQPNDPAESICHLCNRLEPEERALIKKLMVKIGSRILSPNALSGQMLSEKDEN